MVSLADAWSSDQWEDDRMGEIAKEICLFENVCCETDPVPDFADLNLVISDKELELKPPGIPFFTKSIHCYYNEDNLVWPFQGSQDELLSKINPLHVKELIKTGYFMRKVFSGNLLVKYLFHLLCCTTDKELRYSCYNTVTYLLTTINNTYIIKEDLYVALANLGGDLSKLGKDVSGYQPAMFPPPSCAGSHDSQKRMKKRQLKCILKMILQIFSLILADNEKNSDKSVDDILFVFFAIGLDPKCIDVELDTHIATCISHCLNLYPAESFFKSLRGHVERALAYSDYHSPTVVHLCSFCLVRQPDKIFRASVAFHQLQIYLEQQENRTPVDVVQVKDVADLIERQIDTIKQETDSYALYLMVKLLDCCIYNDFLSFSEKVQLSKICDLLKPLIMKKKFTVHDFDPGRFRIFSLHMISKWRMKVGLTGHQQTLDNLKLNSLSI